MVKRKSARKKKVTGTQNTAGSQKPTNLETLRAALEWIVQEGIFMRIMHPRLKPWAIPNRL